MNMVKVRCWQYSVGEGESVFATYPEGNMGHNLMSCLNCGQVYAVNIETVVYIGPPLAERLAASRCAKCGEPLNEHAHSYPEKYLSHTGVIESFLKPGVIPPEETSVIVELPGLYG